MRQLNPKSIGKVLICITALLFSVTVQAETYYFHNDQLGTPQTVTNNTQQVVWKGEYDPFGKVTEKVALVEQNIRFPGQYFDEESKLHYNHFRTYDPTIGRYLSSDPIGLGGGLTTYLYGNANPIKFIDFYGLLADCITYILGTRTEKSTRSDEYQTGSRRYLALVPTSMGAGPDIGPPKNPKRPWDYWRRKTPSFSPEAGFDLVYMEYLSFVREIYAITKVIQTLHSFCEETITDECGNSTVYRSNFQHDKIVGDDKGILIATEKFGRRRVVRKIASAIF